MRLHISIVLFRPRWEELHETFSRLADCRDELATLEILLSGSNEDERRLAELLRATEMTEQAQVVHRHDNLGFASGHNLLLERAFESGADACLVLNPDVEIEVGALTKLKGASEQLLDDSLVGPSLSRLSGHGRVVDSLGIRWTASARHVDDRQGEKWSGHHGATLTCQGVTGACLMVGAGAFQKLVGTTGHFFDDFFLAYREDAELGVRAAAIGVTSVVVEMGGFSHGRHVEGFQRGNALADLLGVRNRFLIRWKLGSLRPGAPVLPTIRDVMVIFAVLARERTSLPGLLEAFRIRRSVRRRRRGF
jgi:GT2 family glycosyltransferase